MYRCTSTPIAADAHRPDEARYVYTLSGWERGPQDADIEKGRGTAQAQATISARPDPEIFSACFRAGVILLLDFSWEGSGRSNQKNKLKQRVSHIDICLLFK